MILSHMSLYICSSKRYPCCHIYVRHSANSHTYIANVDIVITCVVVYIFVTALIRRYILYVMDIPYDIR